MKILDLSKNEIVDVSGGMLVPGSHVASYSSRNKAGGGLIGFIIVLAIGAFLDEGISWLVGRRSSVCDASQEASSKPPRKKKKK